MRFSWAIAVVLVGISVSGWAQQNKAFKVKPSGTAKAPKSSVAVSRAKTAGPATGSAANSKDLQTLEHQTAKSSAPPRSAAKRTPGTGSALKPVKDRPNPPINFSGTGGGKSAGTTSQGSNPYKGRLKQKHSHQ
jgi:hypothetical protein